MDKRITVLDSLRGIAALFVVIYHYTYRFRLKYGHDFSPLFDLKIGFYGVELFFVISGFVIFMTVEQCRNGSEFAIKRFTRLYPTYWLCLLVTFTVLHFFGQPDSRPSYGQLMVNFSMVQYLLHVKSVDGVYWSLLTELFFYLLIFILSIFNWLKRIYVWGAIWLALSVVSSTYDIYYHHSFLKFAGLFYSGVLFYKIYTGNNVIKNHLMVLLAYLVVLYNFRDEDYSIPVITVIYLLFYGFVFQKVKFLNNRVLRFAGFISYPLYLLHQEIGYTIMLYLRKIMPDGIAVILIPFIVSVLIASVVSLYFEKPIIKKVRAFLEGIRLPGLSYNLNK